MAERRIATNGGPDKPERERIYWQLGFIASVVGDMPNMESEFSVNDCCGIMTLLYEIADKVFPEGKQDKEEE